MPFLVTICPTLVSFLYVKSFFDALIFRLRRRSIEYLMAVGSMAEKKFRSKYQGNQPSVPIERYTGKLIAMIFSFSINISLKANTKDEIFISVSLYLVTSNCSF